MNLVKDDCSDIISQQEILVLSSRNKVCRFRSPLQYTNTNNSNT